MSDHELKPCPFCGSTKLKLERKASEYRGRKAYVLSVRCNICHARGGAVTNLTIPYAVKEDVEAAAITLWNRRDSSLELEKARNQLESTKKQCGIVAADVKYYLDNNEENGVVYIPKFVIEKTITSLLKE